MSHSSKTIVLKLGTSVLTQGSKQLNKEHMLEIVRQCALAKRNGHKIIVVTSGAIAAGREHLNYPDYPTTIAYKQLLASVGQGKLIQVWEDLFSIYNIKVGQVLLTRADLEDRERFLSARDTLLTLLDNQIIPVINENDAVATSEIKVGDNDNLSALIAILAEASTLVLLTDQEGLFTKDPRFNSDASLIPRVDKIDSSIYALAGGSVSGLGTGGMTTKIQAAEIATKAGISVVIASGSNPENIYAIGEGKEVGTIFMPSMSPLEARKQWLLGPSPSGKVKVDAGAALALLNKGSSLLPTGVVALEGNFSRGSVVLIQNEKEESIGRGMVNYSSDDLLRICGKHSTEIVTILNYTHGDVVIHRDDCILQTSS